MVSKCNLFFLSVSSFFICFSKSNNLTTFLTIGLDKETLNEIKKRVQEVPEGCFCTVQLNKNYAGQYTELYGVFFNTPEELQEDRSEWKSSYYHPKHFIDIIINEELERRKIWSEYYEF